MILCERLWANLDALKSMGWLSLFVAVMKLFFQRHTKDFVLLSPLFYGDCSVFYAVRFGRIFCRFSC